MVPSLTDKCTEYLQANLDPSNVFSILPSAQKYEEKKLVDECWKVIDKQTQKALKSDAFATIERSLLEEVVERDTLHISEVDLFKEVMQWATKESEMQGLVADGQVKRRILGEKIVKGIRFPVMTHEEFASVVFDSTSRMLTPDEITDIAKRLSSVKGAQVRFPVSKRAAGSGLVRCFRFGSVEPGWFNTNSAIIFRCLTFADCRLQTADRRPQTADCRLQTADCRLQTADYRPQTADYRLQITDCKQWTSDRRL